MRKGAEADPPSRDLRSGASRMGVDPPQKVPILLGMQVTEDEFLNERFLNAKLVQGKGLQALRGNKENKDVLDELDVFSF